MRDLVAMDGEMPIIRYVTERVPPAGPSILTTDKVAFVFLPTAPAILSWAAHWKVASPTVPITRQGQHGYTADLEHPDNDVKN